MTPTAVGLVLVEGHEADGEIMDQDAFDVPTRRGAAAISMSDYVAGALSRTRAIADGRQPHTIGVTWSDDTELEASLLLKSLTDEGFDNVVAVRSPEASEALARGIGRAVGYEQTAVCLVEPENVVVSVVDTHDGAIQTVHHHDQYTGTGLIAWLTDVFDENGWHPQCLIVVGPDAGLDAFTTRLERALGVPVFAPAEAELALARGAALASAHSPDYAHSPDGRRARRPLPYTAALAMLIVGVVTFVVSSSLVAGLQLTSGNQPSTTPTERPASPSPRPAPVAQPVPIPAAPPAVVEAPLPPAEASPVVEEPSNSVQVNQQEQLVDVVPPEAPPEDAPPPEAVPPDAAPPSDAAPPTDAAPLPPADSPPPVPTVAARPPLLTRILNHVPGLHGNPDPPPAPAAPADTPPPPPPP